MAEKIQELDYENLRDLKRVAELFTRELEPHDEAWWRREALGWSTDNKKENLKVFVARKDGAIVGAAVGILHGSHTASREVEQKLGRGKHYCLGGIAVSPEARRTGIAKALNAARLQHARELGARSAYGFTQSTNIARKRQFKREGYTLLHVEHRPNVREAHCYRKFL